MPELVGFDPFFGLVVSEDGVLWSHPSAPFHLNNELSGLETRRGASFYEDYVLASHQRRAIDTERSTQSEEFCAWREAVVAEWKEKMAAMKMGAASAP